MVRRLHSITKECKGHQHYTNATKLHRLHHNTTPPPTQHRHNDNTTPLQERQHYTTATPQHYTTTLNNQYKNHISRPRFKPTSSQRNQHKCLYSQYIYIYILLLLLLYTRFKAVFSRCEDAAKDQNTRDNSAWTAGTGDPMHWVCIPHRIPQAWKQQR